jgi:YD repeat-containing protein
VTEYSYDAASRLIGQTFKNGGAVLGTLSYGYDAAGNRLQTGGSWARTGIPSALGGATYNAANHQVTFGSQTQTFDLNGNLTSDGSTTYTWDPRNRLTGLTRPGLTATFEYDPLGRRTRKVINGTETKFHYDGPNPVQELAGAAVVANLLTGLGVDEFFSRTDAGGTRSHLTDLLHDRGAERQCRDAGRAHV